MFIYVLFQKRKKESKITVCLEISHFCEIRLEYEALSCTEQVKMKEEIKPTRNGLIEVTI